MTKFQIRLPLIVILFLIASTFVYAVCYRNSTCPGPRTTPCPTGGTSFCTQLSIPSIFPRGCNIGCVGYVARCPTTTNKRTCTVGSTTCESNSDPSGMPSGGNNHCGSVPSGTCSTVLLFGWCVMPGPAGFGFWPETNCIPTAIGPGTGPIKSCGSDCQFP